MRRAFKLIHMEFPQQLRHCHCLRPNNVQRPYAYITVNNERKVCRRRRQWPNLGYYAATSCSDRRIPSDACDDKRCHGGDGNRASAEYSSECGLLEQTCSVKYLRLINECSHFSFLWRNNPARAQAASLLRGFSHTQLDTHTSVWTPLNTLPNHRSGRYLHNTQQTQQMNIHALSGFRTREPGK